jgi:CheY-like chemotaxis protein
MSTKLNFLWIDDEPKLKKNEAENLEKRLNVKVEFIDVKGQSLPDALSRILSKEEPHLILMDHSLVNVKDGGFKTGSTAAEIIREKWGECPIVCITAVPLKDIDRHKQSIYEDIFEFENISSYDSRLISMAQSFQVLRKKRPKNVDEFIALLGAPEDDCPRLKSIIPKELKNDEFYQDESLLLTIYRWVRHTLMEKPGFLYDRLWTATLLGIKEESFKKVEHIFEKAKYNGIFSDKGDERWWQSKVKEILYVELPDTDSVYPWEIGRRLPGLTDADFSKCYFSGEDFPETVAYTDESAEKRAPMRLRHTVPHPNFENSLFFEEIRMMKAAE